MQGTRKITPLKECPIDQKPFNSPFFSAYLKLVKPLIDISKRANIAERLQNCDAAIVRISALVDDGVADTSDSSIYTLLRAEQRRLMEKRDTDPQFAELIKKALCQLEYETSLVDNHSFIATRENARALVRIGSKSKFIGLFDSGWRYQSIVKLSHSRILADCDAAIYITPGTVSSELRAFSKGLDIFVLSGWEVLRLVHDTNISLSAVFASLTQVRRAI